MPTVTQAPIGLPFDERTEQILRARLVLKFSLLGLAIVAVLTCLLLFIVEPFQVNGISMQPTFHTGDVVLVWRFPQTLAALTNGQYIPDRGQIVVIKRTPVSGEQLIKRVIGLPGDTIVIRGGKVTAYNASQPNGLNPDAAPFGGDLLPTVTVGTFHTQVGAGQLFVLGDNRSPGASIDSRSGLGNIPSGEIIGRVILRIYPLNKITLF